MKKLPPARVLLLLIFASLVASVQTARATMSVTPQLAEVTLGPGVKRTLYFTLVNEDTKNERTIRYYPAHYRQKEDGAYAITVDAPGEYSCAGWFALDTTEVTLAPGAGLEVSVDIRVPIDVSGTRYGAVAFEMLPPPAGDVWSIGLLLRIPAFVEVTVRGPGIQPKPVLHDLRLLSADELGERLQTDVGRDVLGIVTIVRNPGPVVFPVTGRVLLRDAHGRRYREFPLGGGGAILPGAEVEVLSAVKMPQPGRYTIEVSLDYGGSRPMRVSAPLAVGAGGVRLDGTVEPVPLPAVEVNREQLEIRSPAGSRRFNYVVLRNATDSEVLVRASISGLRGDGRGGLQESDTVVPELDGREWIGLDSGLVVVPARASRSVRVTCDVPAVDPGARYACLVFEEAAGQDAGAVRPKPSTQVPVLITVDGPAERNAEVVEARLEASPLVLTLTIRNTGRGHLTPRARAAVKRSRVAQPMTAEDYEIVGFVDFERPGIILPGDEIVLVGRYTEPLAAGTYRLEATVDCGLGLLLHRIEEVKR